MRWGAFEPALSLAEEMDAQTIWRRSVVSLSYRRQVLSRWAQTIDGGSFRSR
jgi:hypothetical protein